jgi:carbamoyl-phosphate synthase large subunit
MSNYRITTPKAILMLGSGAQKIGQAGEFDCAEYQALRAFRAEGIRTVLVSPNMTAASTSEGIADATYFLPVTPEFVTRIIEKEKPDSLVASFGGKTALSCALELARRGTLEKHNMQVLGTSLDSIAVTEDRSAFVNLIKELSLPVPDSHAVPSIDGAKSAASGMGFPVMVRSESAQGLLVHRVCRDEIELETTCAEAFSVSPEVQVEKWLGGWKEVQVETVRDAMGAFAVVATMENVDPLGVHTGDSIVAIPAQTLSDGELRELRDAARAIADRLCVFGELSVSFALDNEPSDHRSSDLRSGDRWSGDGAPRWRVTEASACASRVTAIASKATGYPVAHAAARVMLGFALSEIKNPLGGDASLASEPSFDYVAVKVPRWDTGKFRNVDRHVGSEMKSVGEAMAFGRTFEEALQKAMRMSDPAYPGIACHEFAFRDIKEELRNPTDLRIFAVYSALAEGWTADRVFKHARIDRWFVSGIARILDVERRLRAEGGTAGGAESGAATGRAPGGKHLSKELLLEAKKAGFSDAQIASCVGSRAEKIRATRLEHGLRPVVRQIDAVSGEAQSRSNFLYLTWSGISDDVTPSERGVLVVGSGPHHIGSGPEYDWCCSSSLASIRAAGRLAIFVNCNPDSVTTDYDSSDRLYFEEISLERVLDIRDAERPDGVLLSSGGPAAASLAVPLSRLKVPILGTNPADIDRAEDRNKFGALLDQLNIAQPEWAECESAKAATDAAAKIGYPALVRAGRGGQGGAMSVVWDDASLSVFLKASGVGADSPVIVSKYVENSKEIEIDAVAANGEILVYAISEHIENAGVHSGDATVVLPAQRIYLSTAQAIKKAARKIACALEITGPFNVQFLAKSANIQAIGCELRAGRSFPFCSKVFRIDMVDIATRAQLGLDARRVDGSRLDFDHVGVRAAQFSFGRLKGADPVAGVEMASTGEVGCIGRGVRDAFMKAMLSTGYRIPERKVLLSTGPIEDKVDFIESARKLRSMGYAIVASGGTARFLQNNGIECDALAWPLEEKKPNIADALRSREVDLVINIPKNNRETELKNDYIIRRLSVDQGIPLITNIKIAKQFIDSLEWYKTRGLEVKSREEYK